MRLIDADALIEFCAERWVPLNIDAVNMQPTIQPEKAQLSLEGTTSDMISREAVIDLLKQMRKDGDMVPWEGKNVFARIRKLPPAQPEPHWIPVSERVPEDYVDVLVWFEYFRYGNYNRMYATHGIGNYSKEYNSWAINHETGWKDLRVIAWMPLPEPYNPNK